MVLTLLGALLVFGGLLFLVALPIWRGRMSDVRRTSTAASEPTLEPPSPVRVLMRRRIGWVLL